MHVLMVCPEYPPMTGGIGRYTANLSDELKKLGISVDIVCDEKGKGDFIGLSPTNDQNSEVLLNLVHKVRPDLVHIQFDPGLYGLQIDTKNPRKSRTFIDSFYSKCKDTPIVTTFHSSFTLSQWINLSLLVKKHGKIGKFGIPLRFLVRFWKNMLSYQAFKDLNERKLWMSDGAIVFSRYMSQLLGGGQVIYHGAEPFFQQKATKKEARAYFSLPTEGRIALATGFRTVTKGWDIIKQIQLPDNWIVVTNSSKSYYNKENNIAHRPENNHSNDHRRIIDLNWGFLTEGDLSMLFYASDLLLLPYQVTSGSGVMFDGIAHGLPFIATNLGFFKEFANKGLGITVCRRASEFSSGMIEIDSNYSRYVDSIDSFKDRLKWNKIAEQHRVLYESIIKSRANNGTREME
jgi:glycosyltransferase involved in cell wall biosynthesis